MSKKLLIAAIVVTVNSQMFAIDPKDLPRDPNNQGEVIAVITDANGRSLLPFRDIEDLGGSFSGNGAQGGNGTIRPDHNAPGR